MVKVIPKTYRTLVKCLKIMEEKGQEVPDFSLEMELEEAVKFFSKLLQEDSNNEVVFEMQHEKEVKEVAKKETEILTAPKQKEREIHSARRKAVMQDKIIEILKYEGTATVPQMMEKTQLSRNTIKSACTQLLEKGIIKRPRRGMYELVDNSELEVQNQMEEPQEDSEERQSSEQLEMEELRSSSEDSVKQEENGEHEAPCAGLAPEKQEEPQLPEGKKQNQRNHTGAKCKELFTNWKYYDVVDYIFTKSAFTVERLRKSLSTKSNEIVEVIQLALKEGCITETEQDGRYKVEDIFRLYYFLLKTNRPIPYSKILADFRGKPDVLESLLKESCEKGMVRGRNIHETMCYEAIK